jgi:putative redox protein
VSAATFAVISSNEISIMQTVTRWVKDLEFEGQYEDHIVKIDTTKDGSTGMNPKRLLLCSLAACSGIDVVGILDKMKVEYSKLEITAEAEQTEDHPKVFKEIFLTYTTDASKEDADKVKRAVELSKDKYCGISAMLSKHCAIHFTIEHV